MARVGLLALGVLGAVVVSSGDKPKPKGAPKPKGTHPRVKMIRTFAEAEAVTAEWDGCLLRTMVVPSGLGAWRAAALALADAHPTTLFVAANMPQTRAALAAEGIAWSHGVWEAPITLADAARFVVQGGAVSGLTAGMAKAVDECPDPTSKPPKPTGPTVVDLDETHIQLQPREGMKIKNSDTAWGLPSAVRAIEDAFARWQACAEEYGHAGKTMRIGDISSPAGGPLPPHKSHQEGRDVDISIQGEGLPVDALPCLLIAFLADPLVSAVFLSHSKQAELWDELAGHDLAALRDELQYPNPPGTKGTRVSHEPGHTKHFHVRFRA